MIGLSLVINAREEIVFCADFFFFRTKLDVVTMQLKINREMFNRAIKAVIAAISNPSSTTFYRKSLFPKSGWVGRVAKRRRN